MAQSGGPRGSGSKVGIDFAATIYGNELRRQVGMILNGKVYPDGGGTYASTVDAIRALWAELGLRQKRRMPATSGKHEIVHIDIHAEAGAKRVSVSALVSDLPGELRQWEFVYAHVSHATDAILWRMGAKR